MDPQRWQKVKALFSEVADLPRGEQQLYLQRYTGDKDIRLEVLQMLKAESESVKGLSTIMLESAKELVAGQQLLNPGDPLGPYGINSVIAEGDSSIVYLADRIGKQFDREVAIKFSRQPFENNHISSQLKQACQILGQLDHPFISRILDAGISDEHHPYIVTEYVEGISIDDYCKTNAFNLAEILELVSKVSQAIHYAHLKGIIHGDIKPENILVVKVNGEAIPKIINFGFAQIENGKIWGSNNQALVPDVALFISPEQYSSNDLTTQSDVYSLGLVLYCLLCGGLPTRESKDRGETTWQPILPPNEFLNLSNTKNTKKLPNEINAVIVKACAAGLSERYQSVYELTKDIGRYRDKFPVGAMPRSNSYVFKKFVQRHQFSTAAVCVIFIGVIAAVFVSANAYIRERDALQQFSTEVEKVHLTNGFLTNMLSNIDSPREGARAEVSDMLDQAEQDLEKKFSSQPMVIANLYFVFGKSRQSLGQHDKAGKLIQKSVDIYQRELGEDHLNTLTAQNVFAENLTSTNREGEALGVFTELLQKSREKLGNDHPLTLAILNNASISSYENGIDEKSEELKKNSLVMMEQLLASRTRIFGETHEQTSQARNELAAMAESLGQVERANSLYRRNLSIQLETFGEANNFTLTTMSSLADNLRKQNQFEEALQFGRRSVNGLVEIQGDSHQNTQRSRIVLLQILVALKSDGQAADVLDELSAFFNENASNLELLNDESFDFYQRSNRLRAQNQE